MECVKQRTVFTGTVLTSIFHFLFLLRLFGQFRGYFFVRILCLNLNTLLFFKTNIK